jgi:hypothetical protein
VGNYGWGVDLEMILFGEVIQLLVQVNLAAQTYRAGKQEIRSTVMARI